jgi:DNA-directed RNA polymerase beta subunit
MQRVNNTLQRQHNTTHNTTQHNTTQHNTTQHNTTQHNTTQHNTTQTKTKRKQVPDRELYERLSAGAAPGSAHRAFLGARAELLLQQPLRKALATRADCLEYLGSHFRAALGLPARVSDHDAGLALLERYVFIHLANPADKLNLLVAMLHKLYALVNHQCCEDNPDALTHHELLLPGHLLAKFVKERLEDSLQGLKDAVARAAAAGNAAALDLEVRLGCCLFCVCAGFLFVSIRARSLFASL